MPAIPKGSVVLVTGVNGYIGSHIAKNLLEHGYRVRGTVRDAYKAEYMHAVFDSKHSDTFEVEIVKDMAVPGAFDEVMKGCTGVIHVASDLTLDPDPHKVIPPVISGIKNTLKAAADNPSVLRFVYTSSSAATTAPIVDREFHVDVTTWNDADVDLAWAPPPYTPARRLAVYAASKTLAEKECWRFVRDENPGFVLNTVCPNCNIGTILSREQPASTGGWYKKMWDGDVQILELLHGFPPQHWVNVTDTALLHVAALLEEDVVGERLLAFAGPFNFNDTADVLERLDAGGNRKWDRINDESKDLKTVDTERPQELLRRYGRPGFADLETSLREAILSY